MKKIFVSIVTLVSMSALMTIVSCSKENDGDVQFKATMEDCTDIHAKTSLQSTGDLYWQDGDVVRIYSNSSSSNGDFAVSGDFTASQSGSTSTVLSGNVSLGNGQYKAIYPASIAQSATTIMLPDIQTNTNGSPDGFPMYAESNNRSLSFKNLCGLLKIVLPAKANTTLASVKLTVNEMVSGTSTVSYSNYSNVASTPTSGGNTITVQCSQSLANGGVVWITLPAGSYTGLDLKFTDTKGCVCTLTHKANASAVPVNRSQYTTIDLSSTSVTFLPTEGVLNGEFSVSQSKKVRFSKGNLQCNVTDPDNPTWQFAANQYDYLGSSNNINGVMDLFGWGTGNVPTRTSRNWQDYTNFSDWANNAVSNGGGNADIWSTLSKEEWAYVLNGRDGASDKRATATVNGVHGVVLLPDVWTKPSDCDFASGIINGWNQNSYDVTEWAKMEASGAVFFPAAGCRVGTDVSNCGSNGHYWSTSTVYDNNYEWAYCFKFGYNYVYNEGQNKVNSYYGMSVRLVYEVR